jgi:hemerythrin
MGEGHVWAAFVSGEDFPNLGHEALDEEHRNIVRLLNDLHDAILQNQPIANQRFLLHQLESYLRVKCRSEEEMMQNDSYPHLENHRKAHEGLYRNLYEFQKVLSNSKVDDSLNGVRRIRDLLLQHVLHEDSRIASWHRIQNISPDAAD